MYGRSADAPCSWVLRASCFDPFSVFYSFVDDCLMILLTLLSENFFQFVSFLLLQRLGCGGEGCVFIIDAGDVKIPPRLASESVVFKTFFSQDIRDYNSFVWKVLFQVVRKTMGVNGSEKDVSEYMTFRLHFVVPFEQFHLHPCLRKVLFRYISEDDLSASSSLFPLLVDRMYQFKMAQEAVRITEAFTEEVTKRIATMAELNLVHRDVKPENILVPADEALEEFSDLPFLGDFGSVLKLGTTAFCRSPTEFTTTTIPENNCEFMGTLPFMPPELWNSFRYKGIFKYDLTYDAYSLGISIASFLRDAKKIKGARAAGNIQVEEGNIAMSSSFAMIEAHREEGNLLLDSLYFLWGNCSDPDPKKHCVTDYYAPGGPAERFGFHSSAKRVRRRR